MMQTLMLMLIDVCHAEFVMYLIKFGIDNEKRFLFNFNIPLQNSLIGHFADFVHSHTQIILKKFIDITLSHLLYANGLILAVRYGPASSINCRLANNLAHPDTLN